MNNQTMRGPLLVFLLLAIGIAAAATALRTSTQDQTTVVAASLKDEKKPTSSQPQPANDSELARLLDQTIDGSEFAAARWGVSVVSLKDGRTIYARNADSLFTPASNMKVYTTAVALDLLGADYRWRTSVYAGAPAAADGTIAGDLTLYGRGAPDLTSRPHKEIPDSLGQLADALYQRGVRQVLGNVIGDESYFRGEPLGDGWQWNDVQWYFGAEPSALSIDDNEVDVEIKPPTSKDETPVARLSQQQGDLEVSSDIAVVKSSEPLTVGIHRGLSDNKVQVWGEFPEGGRGFGARLSVHNPARLAALLFVAALKSRGISVSSDVRTRNFRVPQSQRFDPAHAVELASVSSRTLGEVVKITNKESVNLNAELILRTLGRELGSMVSDEEAAKKYEKGDDETGLAIVRLWLGRNGIPAKALALHDGSGLSRLDLVTPAATVGLLQAVQKTTAAAVFRDSLPKAGTDGTLAGRLNKYKDRVQAKTGTLTYDNSLSGYLTTPDGEDLAFSIMGNDHVGNGSGTRLIDTLVGIIADYAAHTSPNSSKKPPAH